MPHENVSGYGPGEDDRSCVGSAPLSPPRLDGWLIFVSIALLGVALTTF